MIMDTEHYECPECWMPANPSYCYYCDEDED